MYASKIILAALFAMVASAAVHPRQANAACNTARLGVVSALKDADTAIADIQDADVQSAAQDGLTQANDGVSQVAQSIVAGEAPSAQGRDDVEAGLKAANAALADGDAADPAIADAQSAVDAAASAGQDVVANCV